MDVVVLGSLNQDITLNVAVLPLPGETVLARSTCGGPGGKGLNQAIAARRAGALTAMIGAVGQDQTGSELCAFLAEEGIDIRGIARTGDHPTGFASVMVDDRGENAIIVAPGANTAMTPDVVDRALPPSTKVALCQLEVPVAVVNRFLVLSQSIGGITILNAAPFVSAATSLFAACDIVIVNETELAAYAGWEAVASLDAAQIERVARGLVTRAEQTIVVTLGGQGLVRVTQEEAHWHSAPPAHVVDTTGAGDCLCGVLAAELAQGATLAAAIEWAVIAASLSVARRGAAQAMPRRAEYLNI